MATFSLPVKKTAGTKWSEGYRLSPNVCILGTPKEARQEPVRASGSYISPFACAVSCQQKTRLLLILVTRFTCQPERLSLLAQPGSPAVTGTDSKGTNAEVHGSWEPLPL